MPDRRAELEGIKATLLAKIAENRGQAFSLAAENLEHFLMASGAPKTMPLEILRGFGSFRDAMVQLKERMALEIIRIVIGLIERGDGSEALVESEESRRFTVTFEADLMSDLYWAVGTSSIRAIPDLYITLRKGDVDIRGGIQFIWWDLYDWNEGVTPLDGKWWPPTLAAGWLKFGTTYGDLREMNALGIARNYSLRTDWWTDIFCARNFRKRWTFFRAVA